MSVENVIQDSSFHHLHVLFRATSIEENWGGKKYKTVIIGQIYANNV